MTVLTILGVFGLAEVDMTGFITSGSLSFSLASFSWINFLQFEQH